MSTESRSRRERSRRRRGRAFAGVFALVVGVLAVLGVAGAAASVVQGPRVTDVLVDPVAAASASGSRMIVTTSQTLAEVDPAQVTVTPATPFVVDTSGRSVGVRFTLPLWDDTEYTVTISGVESVAGGPAATITQTFQTPAIEPYLLQRGTAEGDRIYRSDLTGESAVPVFTHEHIEDFRATAEHLVISVRTDDDRAALIVTDLDGEDARELALPGDGYVSNLQTADRGERIGYTYSDAELSAEGGIESRLYTASLSEPDAAPTEIVVEGADPRVAQWRFVPDTDSILLLSFDGSLLLTGSGDSGGSGSGGSGSGDSGSGSTGSGSGSGSTGSGSGSGSTGSGSGSGGSGSGDDATTGTTARPATALGSALAIEGIARGSSEAVVDRVDQAAVIDLTDASEQTLVAPDPDLGRTSSVTPLPDGGTVRTAAVVADGVPTGRTAIAYVAADGTARELAEIDETDAVLQVCVSPSARYIAVQLAPDAVDNRYDTYQLPLPERVDTRVIQIADGESVISLSGAAISWCQVPPR